MRGHRLKTLVMAAEGATIVIRFGDVMGAGFSPSMMGPGWQGTYGSCGAKFPYTTA